MQHHQIYDLVDLNLAEFSTQRREIEGISEFRDNPDYEHFDATQLFYDCVLSPDGKSLRFTAPLFGSFWDVFRAGIRIDGEPVSRLKRVSIPRTSSPRCELVEVPWREGNQLSFVIDGQSIPIAPRGSAANAFKGRNALLCVSKNNDLSWIRDWAQFHANAHGADAVVLFDNGSDVYRLEDISACLAEVDGIDVSAVVRAPFEYGRQLKKPFKLNTKFFQVGMLNLARRDFLAQSRAVLSIDIDEMVMRGKNSIFDVACRSPFGMVSTRGKWVFPDPKLDLPLPHNANVYLPERYFSQPKWCATPNGLLSRIGWDVHAVGARFEGLGRVWPRNEWHVHCAGTTTSWKSWSRRFKKNNDLTFCEAVANQWDACLGNGQGK